MVRLTLSFLETVEFDERFNVFPEFVYYDFHKPLSLPRKNPPYLSIVQTNITSLEHLKGSIDRIICDPPFHDSVPTAAITVRWLSKSWGSSEPESKIHTIVCTGERMENLVNKLYRPQGIATTTFEPAHAKGLSNEFRCYANFESRDWTLVGSDS